MTRPADPRGAWLRGRVVCGSPTDADGVTCKAQACVRAWVLGHE